MKLYLSQERLSRFRRSFCYLILLSPQFYYIICYGQRGLFFSPNLYYLFINNKYFQTTIPINTWSPQKNKQIPIEKIRPLKKVSQSCIHLIKLFQLRVHMFLHPDIKLITFFLLNCAFLLPHCCTTILQYLQCSLTIL